MLNTSVQFVNKNGSEIVPSTHYVLSHLHTVAQNRSLSDGCVEVRFSEMEYLPWDNPDNIVSAQVESISLRVKNNMLGFLFLIGGPANVINMAVFYKQGLKDRVNLCLFALSLADELFLIVTMLLHGEQLVLQFTTKELYGPMLTFLANINFGCFSGIYYVSTVMSAIMAMERCHCVLRPLKFQTVMSTRTMAAIIIAVYVIVMVLSFFVGFRYRIGCVYDPDNGDMIKTFIVGKLYHDYKQVVDFLDGIVFGLCLPGMVMMTVITSTIVTTLKLGQIVTWRAGTSSSLSPREVALTKMLIGNSILFITCAFPDALIRFIWLIFPDMNSGGRHQNLFLTSLWITELFCLINSTFNIFVYYAMGSRYRETFQELFRRRKEPNK